jgi:ribonuclease T2
MKSSRRLFSLIIVICISSFSLAREHRQRQSGQPGVFDFYLLTLSWSPEFCHSHSYSPECQSGHHGFIVHGLWPQFTEGYPENCSNAPGPNSPSAMLDIMPDEKLIQHEWTTHGTCSGLSADEYFKLLRRAYTSIKIPTQLAAASEGFLITPGELKEKFLEVNPRLNRDSIAVSCGNNYLTGVYICLTKDLQPTSCGTIRDCRANVIKVTPIR